MHGRMRGVKPQLLGKLDIVILKAGDAEAIFSTPKVHLKEVILWLQLNDGSEDVKKVMCNFAIGAECVDKLHLEGPPCSIDGLYGFIEKNRAALHSISVTKRVTHGNKKLE